ncbi:MAG TPA: glycerophosphodiester phosphodiesterase family protein [Spirochaetota bacterium]|nr:glycerophosphodiester phosphodiesterase family protein [Spirochaetota bacterium]HPJ35943.1 glycerophosphodiester phosphodiesterase family protein [Spirochaetota bacterium]
MEKEFFSPEPVIFSVTGGVRTLPAETMQNFKEGFASGADAACINVQLSKDKELIVISAADLEDVCGVSGPVSQFTSEELKKMDAGFMFRDENGEFSFRGKGYSFMILKELFDSFPDKKFNVTLMHKSDELVKIYAETVKACKAEKRVLTSSMYGKNMKLVKKLLPGSATSFSFPGIIGIYAMFRSGLIFFKKSFNSDALQTPEAIGVSYIANSGLIREMHKRGVRVHVWHIKDKQQYQRVVESGADGFMSDDIPMLKSFMGS